MFGHDERRRSQRLDMEHELVSISWIDQYDESVTRDVMCVDVSSRGIRVEMTHPLDENQEVSITFKPNQANHVCKTGLVVRCTQQSNGWYEIALQLEQMNKDTL